MALSIIDTPANVTRFLPRLTDVDTVIRYITRSSPNGSKHVKIAEVKAIKAAGKKLALVHETWGDFKHAGAGGISAIDGSRDGPYCRAVLPKLGAPAGACVYFAVDTDATKAQLSKFVLPYFAEVAKAFTDGEYRVGVYGPGDVCQAVIDAGYAELGWLSNAKGWGGYAKFKPKAALVQQLPTHIAGGLDVDPNVAQQDDWGQFDPFVQDEEIAGALRLGQTDAASDIVASGGTLSDALDGAKSLFKSKIAWLAGTLGGGGAATTLTSDPDAQHLLVQLMHRPVVWMALGALGIAAVLIYFRWRDHGKGAP